MDKNEFLLSLSLSLLVTLLYPLRFFFFILQREYFLILVFKYKFVFFPQSDCCSHHNPFCFLWDAYNLQKVFLPKMANLCSRSIKRSSGFDFEQINRILIVSHWVLFLSLSLSFGFNLCVCVCIFVHFFFTFVILLTLKTLKYH